MKNVFLSLLIATACPLFGQELKIQTTPPVVLSSFGNYNAVVIGTDAKSRSCPAEYKVYVRIEGKKPWDDTLYPVLPRAVLTPQGEISYSIVCLKLETAK